MHYTCLRRDHKFSKAEIKVRKQNAKSKHRFMSDVAKRFGYSVTLHGTCVRDIDLVAVPWTDDAIPADSLAIRIAGAMQLVVIGEPTEKPHGRIAHAMFDPDEPTQQIDLSIIRPINTMEQGIE